jgi:hypothetical protein
MGMPHKVFFVRSMTARIVVLAISLSVFTNLSLGQKTLDAGKSIETRTSELMAPTPFVLPGNPTCEQLNDRDLPGGPFDTRVDHMDEDFGLKIDVASPNFANVPFNNGSSPLRFLEGGAAADLTRTVSMTTTGTTFNWSSTKQITAVIVKGGPDGGNVYAYKPFSFGGVSGGGTGLITPGGFGVSHVVFCFGVQLVPSASYASISGRVTDANGNPVRGASIQLWNVGTGEYIYAQSGNLGYYVLTDVPVGDFYILSATHGRMSFADSVRSFTVEDDVESVDFVQSF